MARSAGSRDDARRSMARPSARRGAAASAHRHLLPQPRRGGDNPVPSDRAVRGSPKATVVKYTYVVSRF